MEISQITGPAKDPVARAEEDKQVKEVGGVNAVQPVKAESDSKQPTEQEQEAPSFTHVRQDALQLLVRAVTAQLNEHIPTITPAQPPVIADEAALTPAAAASRIVAMLAITFERYRIEHSDRADNELADLFRSHADNALRGGREETQHVLHNLSMLDDVVSQQIERTLELVRNTLNRLLRRSEE